ncbi:MAG: hypothetical protein K2G96_05585, partial [Clostridia bacterium]|nr:hypothetical protein [Clostridia bacterium]
IVCAALFGAKIIIILITVAIKQRIAMHGDISKADKFVCGKVNSCVLSSMRTTKSVTPTVRVNSVVYRVVVGTEDAVYATYSKQFYETDEKVVLAVTGKKRAKLIQEADLENQSEEIKNNYGKCLDTGETVVMKKVYTKTSAGPSRAHRRRH